MHEPQISNSRAHTIGCLDSIAGSTLVYRHATGVYAARHFRLLNERSRARLYCFGLAPPLSTAEYAPLDQDDSGPEKRPFEELVAPRIRRRLRWFRQWPWFLHGAFLCANALALAGTYRWAHSLTTAQCVAKFSTYSPMNDIVEYETNGTFDHPSIYRGPPSPEIDAAWERISDDTRIIAITKDDISRMGKADRPSLVKFQESDGGGYMAGMELVHQLHCVDLLRKYSYREYYAPFEPSFQDSPATFRTHLDHCIEILRQNLMCRGDTGLITFEWVEGRPRPYPDFNTVHQCRNFEQILEWGIEHTVDIQLSRLVRSKDAVDLPKAP